MEGYTSSIIAIIVLVLLSALFSASETAFTSLNRIKIKNEANNGDAKAERVLKLADEYDKLLTTILILNNIVNIAMASIGTVLFVQIYGRYGATIATIVITLVVLVFGEISPKSLAKEAPDRFARFVTPLMSVLIKILTPVNYIFSKWKALINRIFKIIDEPGITEEEIKTIVEEAEVGGNIEAEQSTLIQNAIEFDELTAEDVLTPRVDMVAIELNSSEEYIAEVFKKTGFSRIPVYEDELDKVLGVLNQKDFHNYILGKDKHISDFVKPVVYVAGSMKAAELLRKMQAMKTHIAIIVDEYGGTEGLVTMEDIIEQLVGDIYDEHDLIISQEITELQNGSYRVMCNASLSKVFDFFGMQDQFDVNTVNGWVVLQLDKLPEKGDTFEYYSDAKKLTVRVTKANSRRALEINVKAETVDEKEEQTEGGNE